VTLDLVNDTQQKQKDWFNPRRVTSITAPLPNYVNTSRSVTLLVHYRQFQTCRRVNN